MKRILYIGNKLDNIKSNPSSIGTLGLQLEKEGYTIYYASSKYWKLARLFDMLYSCLKYRNKVDVVLIDTYSTLNFYYTLFVSQLCRILKIDYIPSLNGGNLPYRLEKNPYLSGLIFKWAKFCISPSLYLKAAFEKHGYKDVKYIPNAIEIGKYTFNKKNFTNIRMLWVRSFSEIYNPQLAIRVLKILIDEKYDAKLCMVGPDSDGSMAKAMKLAKELNVDVDFTGKLTKKEWTSLAKEYNIFINTTNFDNMPVSVIEAMALGLPIISTKVGGIPYLISHEKDGLLVKPNDENEFVYAVKRLINQPVFANAIAFNARKKVEQYNWESIRLKWFNALEA